MSITCRYLVYLSAHKQVRVGMSWLPVAILAALVANMGAINRPVYKIALTQKGFAQFVQYDVEIPPIREFTLCAWIRLSNFDHDQTIFTYIVNGNNRAIRMWLDSGGRLLKVSFNKQTVSSVEVNFARDEWRHVCLSYQSDYGAWALYVDARLLYCEAAQNLIGVVIYSGGSVIVGYGTGADGTQNGLEGEIFGVNMILASTIERNYTMKSNPEFEQKPFRKNKVKGNRPLEYVVLGDLHSEEIKHFIGQPTGFSNQSNIGHASNSLESVSLESTTKKIKLELNDSTEREEIFDLVMDRKPYTVSNKKMKHFWNNERESGRKNPSRPFAEPSSSDTRDLLRVSEFETPPPPVDAIPSDFLQTFEKPKPVSELPMFKEAIHRPTDEISEIELPPAPETDKKVYGQWTSSRYAGSVLNYLKSINFHNKEKKVPTTIPLIKVSDNYPYPSEINSDVVRPPSSFQRSKIISESRYRNQYIKPQLKRVHVQKRSVNSEINVKILKDDIRSEILKSHALTVPKQVEITNRGQSRTAEEMRHSRNIYDDRNYNGNYNDVLSKSFTAASIGNYEKVQGLYDTPSSLFNVLPFLKSVEYFTGDSEDIDTNILLHANDMYTKGFGNANKWHNVKSYNNDYTPRKSDLDQKIAEANRRHPSIRLKYRPDSNKLVKDAQEESIIKGRELAIDVSNQADNHKNGISIFKYNHGFLPGHEKKTKTMIKDNYKFLSRFGNVFEQNSNFNRNVKIGNALNEKQVIGMNEEQKKKSFVGGDETIPEIHKYRGNTEHVKTSTKPSARVKTCKSSGSYEYVLYVQPDGTIDVTHIVSPLKLKNLGLEFILQTYKMCSLEESRLERNSMLLINWNKTPVRLFGGAFPMKTKDLCGFF